MSKKTEIIDKQILDFLLKNEHGLKRVSQTVLCQALFNEVSNRTRMGVFVSVRRLQVAGLVQTGIRLTEAGRKTIGEKPSNE